MRALLRFPRNYSRPPALSAIRRGGMAVNLTPAVSSPFTVQETEIMLALLRENAPVPAHEPNATRRCALWPSPVRLFCSRAHVGVTT